MVKNNYPSFIKKIFCFIRYISFFLWPRFTLEFEFKRLVGYKLNIKNPVTYNEKIQYLMLYWYDPLATICADKYLVRDYVKERGLGYLLNDLYGVYDDADDIDIKNLPNEFVLKVNHGCGQNLICKDKNNLNWEEEKKKIKKWMKRNQYYESLEWVYKDIKPKIIIEKLIKSKDGKSLNDYKVLCFNGEPRSIMVISDRNTDTMKADFFDTDWNHKNIIFYSLQNSPLPRPKELDEILEYSKILSKGFPHMRVDFYIVDGNVIFGECTFFPAGGKVAFEPVDYDYELGRYFDISNLLNKN